MTQQGEPQSQEPRPIDKIRRATRDRRRSIEIEAWDLTLYFGPLTTSDVEAVDAAMEDDGRDPQSHSQERRIRLLIEKAELEDGSPAFRPGDRHYLYNEADYTLLNQVVAFMYQSAVSSVDEAVGKSRMTPTSTTGSSSDKSSESR